MLEIVVFVSLKMCITKVINQNIVKKKFFNMLRQYYNISKFVERFTIYFILFVLFVFIKKCFNNSSVCIIL